MPDIRFASTCAAVLFPLAAQGSFGGTPCRGDFACHFEVWGLLLGVVGGIPVSALIFILLHLGFRHHARSKVRQAVLGALIGIVAFELSAACAALMGAWGKSTAGYHDTYPLIGFAAAYMVLAIISVLYARSSPRQHGTAVN